MSKQFLYIVRTRAVFEHVNFNYFQIDTAHKIIQKYEPGISKNAVYKSLDRSRWEEYISQKKWDERRQLEGFKDLDTNGKLRSIWFFTTKNVRYLLDVMKEDFKIREEDYPMYAKIMLGGDDIIGERNLIIEEDK